MALLTNRMIQHLDETGVPYEIVHHKLDFTAQRAAADTHTPGYAFAKTVVLKRPDGFVMVVIPAPCKVDFDKLRELLGGETRLADESDIAELFPDCEVGAEPPFGQLYGLPMYLAPDFADDQFITFNAGTHHEAVRMRYRDYERLVDATPLDVCWRH